MLVDVDCNILNTRICCMKSDTSHVNCTCSAETNCFRSNEAAVLFYIMLATWLRLILTEITICKSEISKKIDFTASS